jgi:hypothetical protein
MFQLNKLKPLALRTDAATLGELARRALQAIDADESSGPQDSVMVGCEEQPARNSNQLEKSKDFRIVFNRHPGAARQLGRVSLRLSSTLSD